MSDSLHYNDQPITTPAEDRFGINPFARALATSIRKLKSPAGSVIGLNGPWGSGKSSAVNLVRHHLAGAVKAEEMVIINFACWWFRGEDALALAFFRELNAGLAPTLGAKVKKLIPKLGARLLRTGAVVGKVAEAAGAGVAGAIAEKSMDWLAGLIDQDESVETLHTELSKALAAQNKRFLIVIDDIDRLSPDEALLIFRLVKSIGRLPNVMYLLVYDRLLAEKIVAERYPSEGPHYLEKIIQAAFELPEPSPFDVEQQLFSVLESICGAPKQEDEKRFMNIFHEGVAPALRTPRDVARFANSLSVTWPAVAGEVDLGDFLALEVLRLLHPTIYRAVRQHKEALTGTGPHGASEREKESKHFDDLLFGDEPPPDERLRRVLMRLFPALEAVWDNFTYGEAVAKEWAAERRVCSPPHFDSYFRFAVGDSALPINELDELIKRADNHDYIARTLRDAAKVTRSSGGTKAAVLLSELTTHAGRVSREKIQPLMTTLFEVFDEINVEADTGKGFTIASNAYRLHWLMRALTLDRMSLGERSTVFTQACDTASIGWLADFTRSAWTDYHPREGNEPERPEKCLTTEEDADHLRQLLLIRIVDAAKDGRLANHRELELLLSWWRELSGDEGANVRTWTSNLFATDDGVKQLAKAFTLHSWAQGIGMGRLSDLVSRRSTHVNPQRMARLVDLEAFRARVETFAKTSGDADVSEFLDAWRRSDEGKE